MSDEEGVERKGEINSLNDSHVQFKKLFQKPLEL
jgi:hypothetical protein